MVGYGFNCVKRKYLIFSLPLVSVEVLSVLAQSFCVCKRRVGGKGQRELVVEWFLFLFMIVAPSRRD